MILLQLRKPLCRKSTVINGFHLITSDFAGREKQPGIEFINKTVPIQASQKTGGKR
jgi:hypothetical protein